MEKIVSFKGKDISLPDHVEMAAKKRAVAKEKKENKEKEALEKAQTGGQKKV